MIVTPSERLPLVRMFEESMKMLYHISVEAQYTPHFIRVHGSTQFHVLHLYLETYAEPELAGQSLAMTSRDSAPYFDLTQGSRTLGCPTNQQRLRGPCTVLCTSASRVIATSDDTKEQDVSYMIVTHH